MGNKDIFAFDPDEIPENSFDKPPKENETSLSKDVDVFVEKQNSSLSKAMELAEWTANLDGIKNAVVVNEDGISRGANRGSPEELEGICALVVTYTKSISSLLSLPFPLGIETNFSNGEKLISLKLKQGFLCVDCTNEINLSFIIREIKNKYSEERK